jgi:hypothetical protein
MVFGFILFLFPVRVAISFAVVFAVVFAADAGMASGHLTSHPPSTGLYATTAVFRSEQPNINTSLERSWVKFKYFATNIIYSYEIELCFVFILLPLLLLLLPPLPLRRLQRMPGRLDLPGHQVEHPPALALRLQHRCRKPLSLPLLPRYSIAA